MQMKYFATRETPQTTSVSSEWVQACNSRTPHPAPRFDDVHKRLRNISLM